MIVLYHYTESHYDFNLTDLSVKEFSEKHRFPYYSVWLLVLIFAAETAKSLYQQRNIEETIFWETFADIKFKAYECKIMHDIYGTFVAEWYPRFYKGNIFKFGCMQYDSVLYPFDTPFVYKDLTVKKVTQLKLYTYRQVMSPLTKAHELNLTKKHIIIFVMQKSTKFWYAGVIRGCFIPNIERFCPKALTY